MLWALHTRRKLNRGNRKHTGLFDRCLRLFQSRGPISDMWQVELQLSRSTPLRHTMLVVQNLHWLFYSNMTRTSPGRTIPCGFIPLPNARTVFPTLLSPAMIGISVFIASRISKMSSGDMITSPILQVILQTEAKREAVILFTPGSIKSAWIYYNILACKVRRYPPNVDVLAFAQR